MKSLSPKERTTKLFLKKKYFKKLKRLDRKKRIRKTKPLIANLNRIQNLHRKFRRHEVETSLKVSKRSNKFKFVIAPVNFSFVENTNEVLKFLDTARSYLRKGKQVHYDLTGIKNLTPETIALYIATIKDKHFTRGVYCEGNPPSDPKISKVFADSGFYGYVHSTVKPPQSERHILLNKITKFKVENETAKNICLRAVKNTFGNEVKFRPIYEILIECMANTNNHASMNSANTYNWWLFEFSNPDTQITSFAFLDLGIGIFKSLPVQRFLRDFTDALNLTSNVDLVDRLMNGEISSKTGLKERGMGMPLIYHHAQNPFIQNFIIISNDVYANLEKNINKKLNFNFAGTFLYWELHPISKLNISNATDN